MQVLRDYEAVLCTYEDENEDETAFQAYEDFCVFLRFLRDLNLQKLELKTKQNQ